MIRSLIAATGLALLAGAFAAPFAVSLLYSEEEAVAELPSTLARLAVLFGLGFLWLLRRPAGLSCLGAAWRREGSSLGPLFAGLLLGLAAPLLAVAALSFSGRLAWHAMPAIPLLVAFGLSGLLTATVEESVFRTLTLTALGRRLPPPAAVLGGALAFSVLHLAAFQPGFSPPPARGLSWSAGLRHLNTVADQLSDPALIRPLIGLLIVGCALGAVWWQSGSLRLCIGLHAGWIVVAKACSDGATFSGSAGGGVLRRFFLISQPAAWLALGASAVLAVGWIGRRLEPVTPPETPPPRRAVSLIAGLTLIAGLVPLVRALDLDRGRELRALLRPASWAALDEDPRRWLAPAFAAAGRPLPAGWEEEFWLEALRLEGPRAVAREILRGAPAERASLWQGGDEPRGALVVAGRSAGSAEAVELEGWYPPEGEGRWAIGRSAAVRLATGRLGEHPGRLEIAVGTVGGRAVEVLLNGTGIGRIESSGRAVHSGRFLATPDPRLEVQTVELRASGAPRRPEGDSRPLAVSLRRLEWVPLRFPSSALFFDQDPYFLDGFGARETAWRWSVAERAYLLFPIRDLRESAFELGLRAWSRDRQSLEVTVNGVAIGSRGALEGELDLVFPVPASALHKGVNIVELSLPGARQEGGDERTLGIAVRRFQLRPATVSLDSGLDP